MRQIASLMKMTEFYLTGFYSLPCCCLRCGFSYLLDVDHCSPNGFTSAALDLDRSPLDAEQDVWALGHLGAGASESEILGIGQLSNVYAITGTHYFHQSNFNFKHHHFHPEKIYLLRFVCIDPASISVKEGLFSSKQHTLRNNSLHELANPASISVPL